VKPLNALRAKSRFLLLSLGVLALDQWTKWLIESRVPRHASIEIVPGFFHISHVRNTGVAFGLFPAGGNALGTLVLVALVLLALGFVSWFFWQTPAENRLLLAALALVLGGAIGNLLDRVSTGAVTDFVGVYLGSYRWPDFNVADSAISIGLCFILLDAFRPRAAETSAGEP
jgi:signal peptidase II